MLTVIALLACAVGCFGAAGVVLALYVCRARRERWLEARLGLPAPPKIDGPRLWKDERTTRGRSLAS